MNLFVHLQQSREIAAAQNEASAAMSEAHRQTNHINDLELRLSKTTLACQAVWELLQKHMSLKEEDLVAKMKEIEARDAAAQADPASAMVECSKCGRKVNPKSGRCLYCGTAVAKHSVFQG
jgi:hypothetical protein